MPAHAKLELACAALTGMAFVCFGLASHASRVLFAVPCVGLWGGYVLFLLRRGERKRLGLSFDGFWRASLIPGGTVLLVVLGSIARRLVVGWTAPPRETWLLLLIYPPWGLVQQLIIQVFVAQNLVLLGAPRAFVIVISALAFGAVHAPDWTLVELTSAAGLVWTWWFLRHPSVIPIAIGHGWSGAFVYGWILDRSALG